MVNLKALDDRTYGFEFSGSEYTLLFKSDDMGFVRFDGKSRTKFYLDPSPFFPNPRNEVYVLDGCPVPLKQKLIRILAKNEDSFITGKAGDYQKQIIKYVRSWEEVDPNTLFRRENIYFDEYVDFFADSFKTTIAGDIVDPIASTMAIYTASSHVLGCNEKGGINTAVRYAGKTKLWDNFKKLLNPIPNEFKKASSNYFFKYGEQEQIVNPLASSEVNLAFRDPKELIAQIPISLIKLDVNNSESYKENFQYLLPFIRAYELDALLFTPDISPQVGKAIEDLVYEIKETVDKNPHMTYNQDIGAAVPKISSSLARLHHSPGVTKDHVRETKTTWFDSYEHAIFWDTRAASPEDLIHTGRMGSDAKQLYYHLLNKYGLDDKIPRAALREKDVPVSEFHLDDAINQLLLNGAIFYPDLYHFKLIELSPSAWMS